MKIGSAISESYTEVNKKGYADLTKLENPMFCKIKKYLECTGLKTPTRDFGSNVNTYSLWYNFLNLNLLVLLTKELQSCNENCLDTRSDTFEDLESLRTSVISSLDPYLRLQVQKRGITLIQNTYIGFDTEYELCDSVKHLNKLLTVQLAFRCRTLIKAPLYRRYDVSYTHPLTSEITTFYKPKFTE